MVVKKDGKVALIKYGIVGKSRLYLRNKHESGPTNLTGLEKNNSKQFNLLNFDLITVNGLMRYWKGIIFVMNLHFQDIFL